MQLFSVAQGRATSFLQRVLVAEHSISAPKRLLGYPTLSCTAVTRMPPWNGTSVSSGLMQRMEITFSATASATWEGFAVNVSKKGRAHRCTQPCVRLRWVTPLSYGPALWMSFRKQPPLAKLKVFPLLQLTVFAQGPIVARRAVAGSRPRVTGGVVQAGAAELAVGTVPSRRAFCREDAAAELLSGQRAGPVPALQRAVT